MQRSLHPADTLRCWTESTPGSESLLSGSEVSSFGSLAQAYGLVCDSYYAECRLGATRQLDLLQAFSSRSAKVTGLAQRLKALASVADRGAQDAWYTVQRFVDRWLEPTDQLHDAIGTIWLEFDDVLRPTGSIAPSVSGCVVRNYGSAFNPREAPPSNTIEGLSIACDAVLARTEAVALNRRIEDVTNGLPKGGSFIHLSWMGARPSRSLKLYGVVPRYELLDYLTRIGFSGHRERVRDLLVHVATPDVCGPDIYFDLNLSTLGDATKASFGIAFSQQQVQLSEEGQERRVPLLERVTAYGQCSRAQARVLGKWASVGDRRWLDLKSVVDPNGNVETKAYLGFAPLRRTFALAG